MHLNIGIGKHVEVVRWLIAQVLLVHKLKVEGVDQVSSCDLSYKVSKRFAQTDPLSPEERTEA